MISFKFYRAKDAIPSEPFRSRILRVNYGYTTMRDKPKHSKHNDESYNNQGYFYMFIDNNYNYILDKYNNFQLFFSLYVLGIAS